MNNGIFTRLSRLSSVRERTRARQIALRQAVRSASATIFVEHSLRSKHRHALRLVNKTKQRPSKNKSEGAKISPCCLLIGDAGCVETQPCSLDISGRQKLG